MSISKKHVISWIFTLGIPLILMLIPTNDVYTPQIRIYCAITLMAIIMFAVENVNQAAVSIMLPIAYIILNIVPAEVALSPWLSSTPWMIWGGLLLSNVMESTGLLQRIAYKCMVLTGGTYFGILIGLALAGWILNFFIPSQACLPMAVLAYSICKALDLGLSKASAGIMLSAAAGALLPLMFMYGPSVAVVYTTGMSVTGDAAPSWTEFLIQNLVSVLFLVVMVLLYAKMFKPETHINGKDYFVAKYAELGKMSLKEKKCLGVCLFLVLAILTTNIHGVAIGWVFTFIPCTCYWPLINIGSKDDIKNVNYSMLLFVVACTSIGTVASALGVGQIITDMSMPIIEGKSMWFVAGFVWILCVVLNFLMTPLAIWGAVTAPLTSIALSIGINPEALYMVIYHACDQIIFPYENVYYLIFFSFGAMKLSHFAKGMAVKMLVNFIFVMGILVPYWMLIGFI